MAYGVDAIDYNTRVPGVVIGYDTTNALQGAQVSEKVCCFVGTVGQKADEKTEKNKVYKIASSAAAQKLFGEDSDLYAQIKSAFKVFFGKFIAIALDKKEDGATKLDFEAVFDELKNYKVDIVSFPYEINLNYESGLSLKEYLKLVGSPKEMRPAIAVSAFTGDLTDSDNEDKLPGKENKNGANNPRVVLVNAKDCDQTVPEITAAVSAMILSQDDPARPFKDFVLPLTGETDYLQEEKEFLLRNGVSVIGLDGSTQLSVVRIISTETDGTSEKVPDLWIRSLDYVREWVRNEVKKCFVGEKLTTRSVERVRSVIFGSLKKLETREIIKNVDALKENLIVEPNPDNIGFLTCRIPTDVVVGLQGMNGYIDLIIS